MAAIATPEEVSFYFALEAIVYGAGCILGPVVGGILADSKVTWRWVRAQLLCFRRLCWFANLRIGLLLESHHFRHYEPDLRFYPAINPSPKRYSVPGKN